jgi:hypothetical protein
MSVRSEQPFGVFLPLLADPGSQLVAVVIYIALGREGVSVLPDVLPKMAEAFLPQGSTRRPLPAWQLLEAVSEVGAERALSLKLPLEVDPGPEPIAVGIFVLLRRACVPVLLGILLKSTKAVLPSSVVGSPLPPW